MRPCRWWYRLLAGGEGPAFDFIHSDCPVRSSHFVCPGSHGVDGCVVGSVSIVGGFRLEDGQLCFPVEGGEDPVVDDGAAVADVSAAGEVQVFGEEVRSQRLDGVAAGLEFEEGFARIRDRQSCGIPQQPPGLLGVGFHGPDTAWAVAVA